MTADNSTQLELVSVSAQVSVTVAGVEWHLSPDCQRCAKPYQRCTCTLMPDRRPHTSQEVTP